MTLTRETYQRTLSLYYRGLWRCHSPLEDESLTRHRLSEMREELGEWRIRSKNGAWVPLLRGDSEEHVWERFAHLQRRSQSELMRSGYRAVRVGDLHPLPQRDDWPPSDLF